MPLARAAEDEVPRKSFLAPDGLEAVGKIAQRAVGAIDGGNPLRSHAEKALRAPAPLGGGIACARSDVAFSFETVKRGVDGADGHFALCARFNFAADGDSVGLIAETHEGEKNDMLELAEVIAR